MLEIHKQTMNKIDSNDNSFDKIWIKEWGNTILKHIRNSRLIDECIL